MKDILTFNTEQLAIFIMTIPLLIISFIYCGRKLVKSFRYGVDFNSRHFMIGLSIAISCCVALINWTTEEKVTSYRPIVMDIDPEIKVMTPITRLKEKVVVPPPPPPKKKETPKLIKKLLIVDKEIEYEATTPLVDQQDIVPPSLHIDGGTADLAPIVVPVEQEDVDKILAISEQMPRFPGCELLDMSNKDKLACSKKELLSYVYENLPYPALARENRIEGMVVIQFVVTKKGTVDKVKIVRDIGAGCGAAAAKVVKAMNELPEKWRPGRHGGRVMNVRYTLPIRFKLQK